VGGATICSSYTKHNNGGELSALFRGKNRGLMEHSIRLAATTTPDVYLCINYRIDTLTAKYVVYVAPRHNCPLQPRQMHFSGLALAPLT
jgi:hypothetical protein